MEILHGRTTIKCHSCGAVAVMDSKTLGAMTEYACPRCGTHMPDRELARIKLHFYVSLSNVYNSFGPMMKTKFDYCLDPRPCLMHDMAESEENGNREGG